MRAHLFDKNPFFFFISLAHTLSTPEKPLRAFFLQITIDVLQ
jgi:hypothetical protein